MCGSRHDHPTAALVLGCLLSAIAPEAAARSRFELRPSLTLTQAQDGNLFSSPDPQRDSITRAAPRLELGLLSPRLDAALAYLQEGERFLQHRSLDSLEARREADLALVYRGRRGLRLEAVQGYRSTRTPGELALATGLELGRAPAEQISSAERLSLGLGPRVTTALAYTLVRDAIQGGVSGRSQSFEVQLERQQGPRAAITSRYTLRLFHSGGAKSSSHVPQLGATATIGRRTQLKLLAGPRLTDGRLEPTPEAQADLLHGFRRGDAALSYSRSQARIVGQIGVASTERGALRLTHELFRPGLRLGISPSVSRTRHAAFDATAYRLDTELAWAAARWLWLAAAYGFAAVRGGPLGDVTRHAVLLRLIVRSPEPARPGRRDLGPPE